MIVYTDPRVTGTAQAVKLEVVWAGIIRVLAVPGKGFDSAQSLATVYKKTPGLKWSVTEGNGAVTLKTTALRAVVRPQTGAVSFYDAAGKRLLAERSGRRFTPAVFEGERLYGLDLTFETTADDALYGLGQHQTAVFNYRGEQVALLQNNTEVGIPFLVSNKSYGILWDNYSLTKAATPGPTIRCLR